MIERFPVQQLQPHRQPSLHAVSLRFMASLDLRALTEFATVQQFAEHALAVLVQTVSHDLPDLIIAPDQAAIHVVDDPQADGEPFHGETRAGQLNDRQSDPQADSEYVVPLVLDGAKIGQVTVKLPTTADTDQRTALFNMLDLGGGIVSLALGRYYAEQKANAIRTNQLSFISSVSHDMRSPLTVIKGYATMMSEAGVLTATQTKFVEKIVGTVQNMTGLVNNILDAGRIDPEGNFAITRAPSDMSAMLDTLLNEYTSIAKNADLDLTAEVEDLPILNLDEELLKSAVANLLDNAVKYTPAGGAIHVQAVTRDHKMEISVTDTGHGIRAEDQKLLFERFRRIARREYARVRGNGLGLYIVRGVARRHNGDATVRSELDKGSTFSITIPLEGANLLGGA